MAFRKKLRIPGKIDEDVAEFLGILTGDGCVNKYVRISDKKRINYYLEMLSYLLWNETWWALFNFSYANNFKLKTSKWFFFFIKIL